MLKAHKQSVNLAIVLWDERRKVISWFADSSMEMTDRKENETVWGYFYSLSAWINSCYFVCLMLMCTFCYQNKLISRSLVHNVYWGHFCTLKESKLGSSYSMLNILHIWSSCIDCSMSLINVGTRQCKMHAYYWCLSKQCVLAGSAASVN